MPAYHARCAPHPFRDRRIEEPGEDQSADDGDVGPRERVARDERLASDHGIEATRSPQGLVALAHSPTRRPGNAPPRPRGPASRDGRGSRRRRRRAARARRARSSGGSSRSRGRRAGEHGRAPRAHPGTPDGRAFDDERPVRECRNGHVPTSLGARSAACSCSPFHRFTASNAIRERRFFSATAMRTRAG